MLGSTIPQKIPVPFAANALSPYIRPIPATSQVAIQNGAASWPDGFPAWCFQPNGFPFGQDFNGVLNSITSWLRWSNAGGPITWDAAFSTAVGGYPAGAIIEAAIQGNFWFNTVDNNLTNPDAGGAGWIGFSLSIPTALIHYGVDAGAADAIVANVNPGIQSYQSGMMFEISAVAANLTPTPTANIQSLGAKTIQRWDGSPLQPSDILPAPVKTLLSCDITANKLYLLNPGNLLKSPPVLIAPRTYYVSNSGSDSNNGLSPTTAFATLQKAANIASTFNLNFFNVTVVVADGTYGYVTLPSINGSGSVNFVGDNTTPTNCVIAGNTTSAILAGEVIGVYTFSGFSLQSAGNPSLPNDGCAGITAVSGGVIGLSNMDFGACSGGHIVVSESTISLGQGALTISGGCSGNTVQATPAHMFVAAGGVIAISGTPSFRPSLSINAAVSMTYFARAAQSGSLSVLYSTIAGAAIVTASKYNASLNGTINTGGSGTGYYPGNTAGTVSTGGQYL